MTFYKISMIYKKCMYYFIYKLYNNNIFILRSDFILDKPRETERKIKASRKKNKKSIQYMEQYSLAGKSPDEMLSYLISGESDDFSIEL